MATSGEHTSEKEEDVALWLCQVDLHDSDEGGVHVIGLWSLGVQHLHRIGAAGNGEDGALEEVV